MNQALRRNAPVPALIGLLALAAIACPSTGFAQSAGPVPSHGFTQNDDPSSHRRHGKDHLKDPKPPGDNDGPGRPVPEPGTMALAGMGLVAVFAAIRKRTNI